MAAGGYHRDRKAITAVIDDRAMTCPTTPARVLLLALAAVTVSLGCGPSPDDPEETVGVEESGDSSTADAPTSGETEPTSGPASATNGDTEGGSLPDEGMFGCGLPSSCPEIIWHLEPYDDPDRVRCAAELIASGEPGVLRATEAPGPGGWHEEMILFVRGDGTALVQTREQDCPGGLEDYDCDLSSQPWQGPWSTRECELEGIDGLVEACSGGEGGSTGGEGGSTGEGGSGCEWWPWDHLSCQTTDNPVCEDLQAILDAR